MKQEVAPIPQALLREVDQRHRNGFNVRFELGVQGVDVSHSLLGGAQRAQHRATQARAAT
jgi:hypothetical protein